MSFSFPVEALESSAHSESLKSHFACARRDFDIFMGQLPGNCFGQGVLYLVAEQALLCNCLPMLHVLELCLVG